jgi:3' terminal RNA ribose 2'-O-methyltransferase Hen1
MLLTISTTHRPATDLGYLLHKNPARLQTFDLAFGNAHVFYPEADEDRCTAALLLEIDPVGLVRGRQGDGGLDQYVNDRPYAASSHLSVAISKIYGTALSGRSKDRPDLANAMLPLTAKLSVVPCRGGESVLRRLFEPLGYTVTAERHPLDEAFPEWGRGPYFTVTLATTARLGDLLSHLYVLVPVLDDDKHYWVGDHEVEKLLRHGEGWLATHPEKALISLRYLKHRRRLASDALARLTADETVDPDTSDETAAGEEEALEERISLHDQRLAAVPDALKASGAASVLDLGCGEGKLLRLLLSEPSFERILGIDVSYRAIESALRKLRYESLPDRQRARLRIVQGSLTYRDARLAGFDAAAVVEVVEHLDPERLAAFERVLFEFARPGTVVLTTPNVEYNVRFAGMPSGALRHRDHRFEWTRAEFADWIEGVAVRHGYSTRILPVGPDDAVVGPPTQMAVFTRSEP